jgi:zinc protease
MKHTVKEVTLKNGLQGLVISTPGASVISVEVSFRAGEFLLDRGKWETAHLMEHLMLGANAGFKTARAFQSELEKNGAYSNASTSVYDVTYELECAGFEADRVIELLVRGLEKPVFKKSEFKAEFGNVSEELVGRSNNHFRALNLGLRQALGLYGLTDQERIELIHNVTVDDVREHYQRTHSIGNARFIIAGDLQSSQLDILESMELPGKADRINLPDEMPRQNAAPLIIPRSDVPNIYFYVDTYAGCQLTTKERDALSVVSTLLTDTLHSKLLGTARELGLVYAMGSGQQHLKSNSSFWLGAQVSKKNSKKLFALISSVLGDLARNGVTESELDAAKQYMRGKYERSAQTVSGTLQRYAAEYYHDGTVEDEAHYNDRIAAVTNKDLIDVIQTVLSGGAWALGLLGSITPAEADGLYKQLQPLFV